MGFLMQDPPAPSIQALLQKIKDGVYKRGIRTTEFFRDFDKRRCGIVTEKQVTSIILWCLPVKIIATCQFASGLNLCCDKAAYLTPAEAQLVVDHYKTADGRVKYTDFCDLMENGKLKELGLGLGLGRKAKTRAKG